MIAHRASTSPSSAHGVSTAWCWCGLARPGRWFVGCYLIWFTLISIGVPEQLGSGGCCGKAGTSDCTCSLVRWPAGNCCRPTAAAQTRLACCPTETFDSLIQVNRSASCCNRRLFASIAPSTVAAVSTTRSRGSAVITAAQTKCADETLPARPKLDQCPCRGDSLPGLVQLDEPRLLGQTTQIWPSPLLFALARCNAGQRPLWVLEPAVPPPRQPAN